MQIERKEEAQQVSLRVTVPAEQIGKYFAKAAASLTKDVTIPGFRKGKAPINVVRTFLGKEKLKDEALSLILDDILDEIYSQEGLTPLFSPKIEVEQLEEDLPLIFDMLVTPQPEFDLPAVEKVQLNLPPPQVTDADVDKAIFRLRESYARLVSKDGQAASGDVVMIKWKMGEEPYHTEVLELGKENFLPGLDEQLLGSAAGDHKHITLELSSQPVELEVEVIEVKTKELPPEDDEFAQNFKAQSLSELRDKVRKDLTNYVQNEYRENLKEEFLKKYLDLIPIDFSEDARNRAWENYVKSFERYLSESGQSKEDFFRQLGISEEDWKETVARDQSLRVLKEQLVLNKVAEERQIEVSKEELQEALKDRKNENPLSVYESIRRRKALEELFHDWQTSQYLKEQV